MSFGVGVGDIIAVGELAWNLYRYCYQVARGAPQEFQALLAELNTLSNCIKYLQEDIQNEESTLVSAGEDRLRAVKDLIGRVEKTLRDLEKFAKRYEILQDRNRSRRKQFWERFRWSTEAKELDSMRNKLSNYNGVLHLLLTSAGNSSLERVEANMRVFQQSIDEIKNLMRANARRESSFNVLSSSKSPVLSIGENKLFQVEISREFMKTATEFGQSTAIIGIEQWINAGRWWLLMSQMQFRLGKSDDAVAQRGYVNFVKASWILIDVIQSHPQLNFLEQDAEYELKGLIEPAYGSIHEELKRKNDRSPLDVPILEKVAEEDLQIWTTRSGGPSLRPTQEAGTWKLPSQEIFFRGFGLYQPHEHTMNVPCLVVIQAHKNENKPLIVLYNQLWMRQAEIKVSIQREEKPRLRGVCSPEVLVFGQRIKFHSVEDAQFFCASAEACAECFSRYDHSITEGLKNDLFPSFILLVGMKRNFIELVKCLLGRQIGSVPAFEFLIDEDQRLLRETQRLANLFLEQKLDCVPRCGKEYPKRSLFQWITNNGYESVATLLLKSKGLVHIRRKVSEYACPTVAARHGWNDVLQVLLEDGWDDRGYLALQEAILYRNTATVSKLLEVAASDGSSVTVLEKGVKSGHCEIVKQLLNAGAPISKKALRSASKRGHNDIVKQLLDAGAPTSRDAVKSAAYAGHINIVKQLLDAGAPSSNDAVKFAAAGGHNDLVKQLLDSGAPVCENAVIWAIKGCNGDILKQLLDAGAQAPAEAVSRAAMRGSGDIVKQLLNLGVPASEEAVVWAAEGGYSDIVEQLLDAGASASSDAVKSAAAGGHNDTVKQLLRAGVPACETAVAWAVKECNVDITKQLLEAGAHAPGEAMSEAAKRGSGDLVQQLLNAGVPASEEAVSEAAKVGNSDIVKQLVDAGADISSYRGRTALYAAAQSGHTSIIDLLLESNASVTEESIVVAAYAGHDSAFDQLRRADTTHLPRSAVRDATFLKSVRTRDSDFIEEYITQGLFCKDAYASMALEIAVSNGFYEIVDKLLEAGFFVHPKTLSESITTQNTELACRLLRTRKFLLSPQHLHEAVETGNEKMVGDLLRENHTVGSLSPSMEKALSAATELGHEVIIDLLLDASE